MTLAPILRDEKFDDSNDDDKIIFGKPNVTKYGVKVVYYQGFKDGKHVYWPEGYVPPVPKPRVEPPNIEAPRLINPSKKTSSQFLPNGEFVRSNTTSSGLSAVYKQQTDKTITKLSLTDYSLVNTGVLFRNYGGPLDNVTIDRIEHLDAKYSAGVGKGVFHTGNDRVTNVSITNVRYVCVKPVTSPGDIYAAVTLNGEDANDNGENFLIQDCHFEGFWAEYSGKYIDEYKNVDGLCLMRKYINGKVNRVYIGHGSDAGIDIKASGWEFDNLTIEDFRENIKIWNDLKIGSFRSINPRFAHILCPSAPTRTITVDFFQPEGVNPAIELFRAEKGVHHLTIKDGDFSKLPANQVIITSDRAGRGSTVTMPDGTVHTAK